MALLIGPLGGGSKWTKLGSHKIIRLRPMWRAMLDLEKYVEREAQINIEREAQINSCNSTMLSAFVQWGL